jgi:hypothetical protein
MAPIVAPCVALRRICPRGLPLEALLSSYSCCALIALILFE